MTSFGMDLLALMLATGAVLDAWGSGSLFRPWRQATERWPDSLLKELVQCSFCLSYHVPAYLLAYWLLVSLLPVPWLIPWFRLPVYALALTRLSNLLNAWLPEDFRYAFDTDPKSSGFPESELKDDRPTRIRSVRRVGGGRPPETGPPL